MPVDRIKELVQEGLRRKLSGDLQGAADAWQEALLLDPSNERARAGLEGLTKLGLQAPSDPLMPGVTPAMGLLFTPPSVVVPNSRRNPFARPDREQKSQPVSMTPSPFESVRTPLSLLVRGGIEASPAEASPSVASSQTLVLGFAPPEALSAPRAGSSSQWIDIGEALGAVEKVASETVGSLYFGEASEPQSQRSGPSAPPPETVEHLPDPVPAGASLRGFKPAAEPAAGALSTASPARLETGEEPSLAAMTKAQIPSTRESIPASPPAPRFPKPGPVPLPGPPLATGTPPQFPAFPGSVQVLDLAAGELPMVPGRPPARPGPEAASAAFEERFPTPTPGPFGSAPELSLAFPDEPELPACSPFPMTPRPFTVKVPVPPGGTLDQFAAPPASATGAGPSPSPFPRTPRPFPVEAPAASGMTNVQFPSARPERRSGGRGPAEEAARPAAEPARAPEAPATVPGFQLEPPESDPALEIEIEVDLGASPEPGEVEAPDIGALLMRAADQLDLDDHTGALKTVEAVLALEPQNATAHELLERCESTLLAMFESKLGDLSDRPQVKLKPDEIVWLNLDNRAGFLLSMVDGQVSYEDLFALSSMSRLDTARILVNLLQARAIG
jgi:hypothetical protein